MYVSPPQARPAQGSTSRDLTRGHDSGRTWAGNPLQPAGPLGAILSCAEGMSSRSVGRGGRGRAVPFGPERRPASQPRIRRCGSTSSRRDSPPTRARYSSVRRRRRPRNRARRRDPHHSSSPFVRCQEGRIVVGAPDAHRGVGAPMSVCRPERVARKGAPRAPTRKRNTIRLSELIPSRGCDGRTAGASAQASSPRRGSIPGRDTTVVDAGSKIRQGGKREHQRPIDSISSYRRLANSCPLVSSFQSYPNRSWEVLVQSLLISVPCTGRYCPCRNL
jgi:hypothetical protein